MIASNDESLSPLPRQSTIGVLAGMGPRSTSPFVDALVTACQKNLGCKFDEDFPPIMILSWPTPFRLDGVGDSYTSSMTDSVKKGFQKLIDSSVDILCMPCNSAHVYLPQNGPERPKHVKWISIVSATVKTIPHTALRVILWATQNTFRSGIYQKELSPRLDEKLTVLQQPQVDRIISFVKEGNIVEAGKIIKQLIQNIVEKQNEVTVILVACTDITVALLSLGAVSEGQGIFRLNHVCFVDSSVCLASEVVNSLK